MDLPQTGQSLQEENCEGQCDVSFYCVDDLTA